MASFAKIELNGEVVEVQSLNNDVLINPATGNEEEERGVNFLKTLHNQPTSIWKQTSYNTQRGQHILDGTPFRKNHAGIGYTYDESRDAFIPPKPYPSWTLNETTCVWDPPVAFPTDDQKYLWNEDNQTWDVTEVEQETAEEQATEVEQETAEEQATEVEQETAEEQATE